MRRRVAGKNPIVDFLSGLFSGGLEHTGLYYSLYRGIVYSNEDPENLQRLQLIIPQLTGSDYYSYWALPRNVFFGAGYGEQKLPAKGDLVWVEFEGGKPEIPVWSHGHPGKKEVPLDEELISKQTYYFVSPKGHKVLINDTKDTIHIQTRFGDYMELSEKSISLVKAKIKHISLGSKDDSEYSAVLGEKLVALVERLDSMLKTWSKALEKDLLASSTSPYLKKEFIAAKIVEIRQQSDSLENMTRELLSDLVKLDK